MTNVRVSGYLRSYCEKDSSEGFEVSVPEDARPTDFLQVLGIPVKGEGIFFVINPGGKEKTLTIENGRCSHKDAQLKVSDTVWIYPFLDGG
jgi:hypothetical protein